MKHHSVKVDPNAHYYEFLDWLRESGKTNMFGAAPYLAKAFDITKFEARAILKSWMEQYGQS